MRANLRLACAVLVLLTFAGLAASGYGGEIITHEYKQLPLRKLPREAYSTPGSTSTPSGGGGTVTHVEPKYISVRGVHLQMPVSDPTCGSDIESALLKKREIYVSDSACRAAMDRAFEIERTVPEATPDQVGPGTVTTITPEAPVSTPTVSSDGNSGAAASGQPGRLSPYLHRQPN